MQNRLTKTYDLTIAANGFVNVPVWGNYFRVKEITAGATVTLETAEGDSVQGMGLAQSQKFDSDFSAVRVLNDTAGAITVKALIGFGLFGDNEVAGSVTISGTANVADAAVLAMLQNADDQRKACNLLRATPFYLSSTAGLQTLVTPAANTAGIIISTASMYVASSLGSRIMAKTSAPTSWDDTTALTIALTVTSTSTQSQYSAALPLFVPSGLGLYMQQSGAGAAITTCTYEVL